MSFAPPAMAARGAARGSVARGIGDGDAAGARFAPSQRLQSAYASRKVGFSTRARLTSK